MKDRARKGSAFFRLELRSTARLDQTCRCRKAKSEDSISRTGSGLRGTGVVWLKPMTPSGLGAARADAVRRARTRDGGDGRRAGAGKGRPRADRGSSWRGGRGQVA